MRSWENGFWFGSEADTAKLIKAPSAYIRLPASRLIVYLHKQAFRTIFCEEPG